MSDHSKNNDRRRIAGPVGRVLRIAAGLLLLSRVAGFYLNGTGPFVLRSAAAAAVLVLVYILVHRLLPARSLGVGPWFGALAALAPLVLVYVLGMGGGPIFGAGEGQLAVLSFLGVSLVLAGLRGDTGCEVMALPNALTRRETHLACLVFSPIDRLEHPRSKDAVKP